MNHRKKTSFGRDEQEKKAGLAASAPKSPDLCRCILQRSPFAVGYGKISSIHSMTLYFAAKGADDICKRDPCQPKRLPCVQSWEKDGVGD